MQFGLSKCHLQRSSKRVPLEPSNLLNIPREFIGIISERINLDDNDFFPIAAHIKQVQLGVVGHTAHFVAEACKHIQKLETLEIPHLDKSISTAADNQLFLHVRGRVYELHQLNLGDRRLVSVLSELKKLSTLSRIPPIAGPR